MGKIQDIKSPFISIVIPTLNSREELPWCLNSLRGLDHPKERMEIIIWENGSTDGTQEAVNTLFSNMRGEGWKRLEMIPSPENLGVYTSRDELFKRVNQETDFILSLDDDVFLPPDTLKVLLGGLDQFPAAGIIGPRTVYEKDQDDTAHGAGLVDMWTGKFRDIDSRRIMECDYVIGCCMLITAEVVSLLKGFDRDYYTSHGEVDFCLKAKRRGYKVLYDPGVVVRHNVDKGGTRTPERMYYIYRNKLQVFRKNASPTQKIFSMTIYLVLGFMKNIVKSLLRTSFSDFTEATIILWAFTDGFLNRRGKSKRDFSKLTRKTG